MSDVMEIRLRVPASDLDAPHIVTACQKSLHFDIVEYLPPWDHTRCDITKGWVNAGTLADIKNKMTGHEIHNEGLYAVSWNRGNISPFHDGAVYIGQSQQTCYVRLNEWENAFRGINNNHRRRPAVMKAQWENENNRSLNHEELSVWYRLHNTDGYLRLPRAQSEMLESMALNAHYLMQKRHPTCNLQSLKKLTATEPLVLQQLTDAGWI